MNFLRIMGNDLFGCAVNTTTQGVQRLEIKYKQYQYVMYKKRLDNIKQVK